MAQIGKQSFLLDDIKLQIRNGGNVTHILNVKVSNQQNPDQGNRIRQRIFQHIANRAHNFNIMGMKFAITWRTRATTTSAYYHCDVGGLLGDMAVKEHSKVLLRNVLNEIDNEFRQVFSRGVTGVAFLVSKPLVREVVLVDDDISSVVPANNDVEEELDDGEENI